MPTWTFGKPVADWLGFVRAVVVHDDVDVEIGGHIALDLIEEFAELLRTVPSHAFADDSSSLHVERRKQRRRSIPFVVMCAPLDLAGPHWQQWLGAVEGLHLGFFVDPEHESALRRAQLRPEM